MSRLCAQTQFGQIPPGRLEPGAAAGPAGLGALALGPLPGSDGKAWTQSHVAGSHSAPLPRALAVCLGSSSRPVSLTEEAVAVLPGRLF